MADVTTQLQFAARRQITKVCTGRHAATSPSARIIPFTFITARDITQALSMEPRHCGQLDVGTLLSHMLPRYGSYIAPCSFADCGLPPAPASTVETSWPRCLLIAPETTQEDTSNTGQPQARDMVAFPLEFEIPSRVENRHHVDAQSSVRYRMVGRQLYSRNHFTAELLLQDSTYLYDDTRNYGRLSRAGEESLITVPRRDTIFVLYNRVSDNSVSKHHAITAMF